jgi:flagellar biosynthetic protein FliP
MDAHVKPLIVILFMLMGVMPAMAQETPVDVPGVSGALGGLAAAPAPRAPTTAPQQGAISASNTIAQNVPNLASPQNFSAAMQIIILLTVLSLAPAILIMMTSFTRFIIVLSLLRQALGTQQLPPNQILIGLSLFMTFIVMLPTWQKINSEAIQPYMNNEITQPQALANAQVPLRNFMISQIREQKNDDDVYLFASFSGANTAEMKWKDVTTMQLIPAFMLSELKTAFLMGFTVYLPFLIVDMVISSILISMGMMMLPPVLISLPFKLLLFVLVDGWRLITGNLMGSFVNS